MKVTSRNNKFANIVRVFKTFQNSVVLIVVSREFCGSVVVNPDGTYLAKSIKMNTIHNRYGYRPSLVPGICTLTKDEDDGFELIICGESKLSVFESMLQYVPYDMIHDAVHKAYDAQHEWAMSKIESDEE